MFLQLILAWQSGMFQPVSAQTQQPSTPVQQAAAFHQIFSATIGVTQGPGSADALHYLPDENLQKIFTAPDLQSALQISTGSSLYSIGQFSKTYLTQNLGAPVTGKDVDAVLARHPLTIVILPGIFGEFIPVRAFEEVFAQSAHSKFAAQFTAAVQSALGTHDKDAATKICQSPGAPLQGCAPTYDLSVLQDTSAPLDQLVNVGSFDDSQGNPLVKVVLLYTPQFSLETMANLPDQAARFNDRLERYLALMGGSQDLVLLGYSRGATTALEMLSQANRDQTKHPWINHVKGMISLSGVLFGSALADQTEKTGNPSGDMVSAAQNFIAALQIVPDDATDSVRNAIVGKNLAAYGRVALKLGPLVLGNIPKIGDLNWIYLQGTPLNAGLDPRGNLPLIKNLLVKQFHLQLAQWATDYNQNIKVLQQVLETALTGVSQLAGDARAAWWNPDTNSSASTILPSQGITYYAITAAMADPGLKPSGPAATFEKAAFAGSGYSNSYDDYSLLQNHQQYSAITTGVTLNDSQVSIPTAVFLPNVIALNPQQPPLSTKFLGTMSTHHWGMALKVVNTMRNGAVNKFPRAAMLKALAAQVATDLDSAAK